MNEEQKKIAESVVTLEQLESLILDVEKLLGGTIINSKIYDAAPDYLRSTLDSAFLTISNGREWVKQYLCSIINNLKFDSKFTQQQFNEELEEFREKFYRKKE